ncbi:putative protein FAM86A 1-like [Tropilaelaps mercedesae]|uniref:FAM86 N-terminal domain-containing protein n=1 Tax=Tropilaelaps mercedesae TaxID=418985 RepID=A0A1V9XPY2_9ACAR|nr:putative protein FAM86A 1-like [Tropilaelaps mercedesae]
MNNSSDILCRSSGDGNIILTKMKNIAWRFLECRPISEIADAVESLLPDLDEELLVKVVFRNCISTPFPPHKDYRLSVLKALISRLDSRTELGDALYEELSAAISAEGKDGFVTYMLNVDLGIGPLTITLKETRAFASHGTTGLKSWPASKVLSEVLLNLGDLRGQRIVELGSGVGLTGLCVLKARPLLESFVFTDCHGDVLRSIEENIEINLPSGDRRARVQFLDWCIGGNIADCDLIVGSDIVFDRDAIRPLVNLIVQMLAKNNVCEAIIASVIRNKDTYASFRGTVKNSCDIETVEVKQFRCFDRITDDFEVIRVKNKSAR